MGEVTDEQLMQIANGFLLAAPPGELNEVVQDVRCLLNNDDLLNRNALETFRTYNTTQMLQIQNGDHEVLITKMGELGPNEYLDPLGKQVITFDHIKQQITGHRDIKGELDSSVEPFRKAIEDAAVNYVNEHYQNGAPAVYSAKEGSELKVTICISSSKFSPTNFWGGRWRSVWVAKFKPGSDLKLEGNVAVQVHYYEDGNVQLNTKFLKNAGVKAPSDAKALAEACLKEIGKLEQEYHTALEHSYNTMGETTFKALRRVLPITRERIKWEKIKNYRIGSDVTGK
jgi:capping protein alpha